MTTAPDPAPRLTSVDALRGLVMVIMALDHTRDFFHVGAMTFSPEDLSQTTPILFFTRWVTHICAPVFLFTSGMGAFLRLQRPGATKAQLSWFLWTRGLWLILIELTVMRLAFNFSFSMQYPVLLLVLWALGISMIALAALIYLPLRVLAGVSVAVILLHNAFDGVQASEFGSLAGVWNALHQPGVVLLAGVPVIVGYPVMPWVAVMAAGFCAGTILLREPQERRRLLTTWGRVLIVAFVVVRTVNVYGDPAPWSSQPSPMFTVLSFLRTTKYPPSLAFLLMTIGPALLLLAWFDRRGLDRRHPLVILLTIGRVPFFYYVTHFWALHLLAACMAWLKYGAASFPYLLAPVPSMGGPRALFPPDFGYPLWVVYVVWVGIVAAVYPLCRWFAAFKARRRDWWLSYL